MLERKRAKEVNTSERSGDAGVSQPDVPPAVGVINYVLLVFQHMC